MGGSRGGSRGEGSRGEYRHLPRHHLRRRKCHPSVFPCFRMVHKPKKIFWTRAKQRCENFWFASRQNQGVFPHNLRFFRLARAFSGVASVGPEPHKTGVKTEKTTLGGPTVPLHKLQQTELVSGQVAWLGSVRATGKTLRRGNELYRSTEVD